MPRQKLLPDADTLAQMWESGMTQQQIADEINEKNKSIMGTDFKPVSRSAVATELHRNGLSGKRPTYKDVNPWKAADEYQRQYPIAMLRLWKRRENGEELPKNLDRQLDGWLAQLERENAVVDFKPEFGGFIYTRRRDGIDLGMIREPNK